MRVIQLLCCLSLEEFLSMVDNARVSSLDVWSILVDDAENHCVSKNEFVCAVSLFKLACSLIAP